MIERILPGCVASAEAFEDPPYAELFPAEAAVVDRAVGKRRREFTTVRYCARQALAEIRMPPVPILPGPQREPQWPAGVVGSMTHCEGYRAAAVAREGDLAALGIDAEPHEPLPDGVLPLVARPEELLRLTELRRAQPELHWDRLTFSAKESVYKAWFPLTRRWLGFQDATLTFDPDTQGFDAELHQVGPVLAGRPLTRLTGRWIVDGNLIVTSVAVR